MCLYISVGYVSAEEKKFQWSVRLTASQQYDDNIFLSEDNEESEWLTTVGPGLTLSVLTEKTPITLDYDLGFTYYARNKADDELRHRLALNGPRQLPGEQHPARATSHRL